MGLIKRPNSNYWYYQFRIDGKNYVGSTRTTSKAKAAKIEQKRRNEVHAQVIMGEAQPITLGEAIKLHMESKKKLVSFQNVQAACHRLQGFILDPQTGDEIKVDGLDTTKELHKITTAEVERLLAAREKTGYSAETCRYEMRTIRQIVSLASKRGYKTNPKLDVPNPKVTRTRVRYLTSEEEESFLKELKNSKRKDNYDFGLLLLDTGMRYMEAASLPWSAIDMKAKTITVYRSKVGNESILSMTTRVHKMMKRRFQDKGTNRYVFMSNDGSTHRQYTRDGIDAAFTRAGLNDAQIVLEKGSKATSHTLRHTFASKLAQKGMSLHEIAKLLGHSSTATTEIYSHLCPNTASQKAVQLLED